MSEPRLQPVMRLSVQIGQGIEQGTTNQGLRIDYPVIGGHFDGPGLKGKIPEGGADYYLEREDGSGVLNARYSLHCDDGAVINVHNRGLLMFSEAGQQLAQASWPIPESEYRCRCAPEFTTDSPRYRWLMDNLFIGIITYPTEHQVWVECYRVD